MVNPFLFLLGTDHQVKQLAFSLKFERVLSLDKEYKEIILLWDTNWDYSEKQAAQPIDNDTKHIMGVYELFSLKQLIEEPTRVAISMSTLIILP